MQGPSRRLPIPVLALTGATSYWASVVANPPGHMSTLGAQGTSARMVAPCGLARADSLYRVMTALNSMDRRCSRNDPFPKLGLGHADIVRASHLQHAIEGVDRHVNFS